MAYSRSYRTSKRTSSKSKSTTKKQRNKELLHTARVMGQVERGLKNPDSLISQAYNSGKSKPAKKQNRTMF